MDKYKKLIFDIFNHNMQELKEKTYELIIDVENQELTFEDLAYNVQKWPEVTYYDEENNSMNYDILGTDNCSIIEINDDYIELIAGNDYQTPHLVRIELCSGELTATYFEPSEFLIGLDFEEVVEKLQF